MTTREWHELIKPVLAHASADKELPELGVVRIETGPGAVYAVATDRCTLAAERHPLYGSGEPGQPVHVSAKEAAATLKLFTHNKDEDPALRITIDTTSIPVQVVGQTRSLSRLAVTLQSDDGTRLVLHDVRDPARDPLSGWRRSIRSAMSRPGGHALEGLDLVAWQLARWASAARRGERLTVYSGPEPGDPLLVTVEQHFAGIWAVQQYLDAPAKTLGALPWRDELVPDGIDPETGEKSTGDIGSGDTGKNESGE
jgi:hypothetical protein